MMATSLRHILQVKVSLNYTKPPIWRRLLVDSAMPLSDLHIALQIAMGWTNSHLHMFVSGAQRFGIPDPDFDLDDSMIDEAGVRVGQLLKAEKQSLIYEYDFGDDWAHTIKVEKVLPFTPGETLPRCTGGRRCCPPEDVGGVGGYQDFLEKYLDSSHPEHEAMLEWAGDDFDPEDFDREEVNDFLQAVFSND